MEEASRIVESAGIRPTVRIELGVPHQEILKVAEEEKVSLIVCGRERRGALDEIFHRLYHGQHHPLWDQGRFIFQSARTSTAPTGRPAEAFCRDPFRRVLYPTDWSELRTRRFGIPEEYQRMREPTRLSWRMLWTRRP
ncbi:MAG: universal stress protein [Desulfobacterales bacterium]|nr:universal stress protein [Desulfobacterales bacterium]